MGRRLTVVHFDDKQSKDPLQATPESTTQEQSLLIRDFARLEQELAPKQDSEYCDLRFESGPLDGASAAQSYRGSDLRGRELTGTFENVRFNYARLDGADLSGCTFIQCSFKGTSLCGADLSETIITGNLAEADLQGAYVEGALYNNAPLADSKHWEVAKSFDDYETLADCGSRFVGPQSPKEFDTTPTYSTTPEGEQLTASALATLTGGPGAHCALYLPRTSKPRHTHEIHLYQKDEHTLLGIYTDDEIAQSGDYKQVAFSIDLQTNQWTYIPEMSRHSLSDTTPEAVFEEVKAVIPDDLTAILSSEGDAPGKGPFLKRWKPDGTLTERKFFYESQRSDTENRAYICAQEAQQYSELTPIEGLDE